MTQSRRLSTQDGWIKWMIKGSKGKGTLEWTD
jgi:hypothetical protein